MVAISFLIIIFPILLSGKVIFCGENKTIYLNIMIFGVKIFRCRFVFANSGIIRITGRKSKLMPYKNLVKIKSGIKVLKDYHFISLKTKMELGSSKNLIPILLCGFLFYCATQFCCEIAMANKPYVSVGSDVNVSECNQFKFDVEAKIIFNLLMILLSVIKTIWGKIVNGKKQQNKRDCRNCA